MQGPASIFTVVAPASSYDLTTLAAVQSEANTNIADAASNTVLARYITEASIAAANYCNRVFAVETVMDRMWPQRDGWPWVMRGGLQPLQLTRWPVVYPSGSGPVINPLTVTENGVALVQDVDYIIDAIQGQLVRLDSFGYPRRWAAVPLAVQYDAGYTTPAVPGVGGAITLPADVSAAVNRMVSQRFFARGRDPNLRSENVPGVYEAAYWVSTASGSGTSDGNLTPDVQALLDNYRYGVVA